MSLPDIYIRHSSLNHELQPSVAWSIIMNSKREKIDFILQGCVISTPRLDNMVHLATSCSQRLGLSDILDTDQTVVELRRSLQRGSLGYPDKEEHTPKNGSIALPLKL